MEKRIKAEEKYSQETKYFLETVYFNEFKVKPLLLVQPSFSYQDKIINDKYFSALDRFQIKSQINYPRVKNWRKLLGQKVNFISSDTVRMAFRDLHSFGFWTSAYPGLENGVKSISAPIFLQDYSYCVFYSNTSYVRLKETGTIAVYKKRNGKWSIFKKIYAWKKR